MEKNRETRCPLKLGIIGAGAVTELNHLPAVQRTLSVEISGLADIDVDRARELANKFDIPFATSDYHDLFEKVDALLIATPPHTHYPIAHEILARNIPILCEKPLALKSCDAFQLAKIADERGVILAVGHNRRHSWNLLTLRNLLDGGGIGKIIHTEVEDGFQFGWPARTNFFLDRSGNGSGVLIENGIHVIDVLLWLFGEAKVNRYEDDSLGGIESNARLGMIFLGGSTAEVWITRTTEARNRIRVIGSEGWVEAPIYDTNRLIFEARKSKAGKFLGATEVVSPQLQDYLDLLTAQYDDFAKAIILQQLPRTTAFEAAEAVELVEKAYTLKNGRSLPDPIPQPGETW